MCMYVCMYVYMYIGQIYFNVFFYCSPPVYSSLLSVFEETGFTRRSLGSAEIFGAVVPWSFLTIRIRVRRSQPDSFRILPEFCFSEEVFPSFSNAVITFETVLLSTPNNSVDFVTLVPVIRAPTIWPLLKSDWSALLNEFWLISYGDNCENNRQF